MQYAIMRNLVGQLEKGKITRGRFMSLMLSALYPQKVHVSKPKKKLGKKIS